MALIAIAILLFAFVSWKWFVLFFVCGMLAILAWAWIEAMSSRDKNLRTGFVHWFRLVEEHAHFENVIISSSDDPFWLEAFKAKKPSHQALRDFVKKHQP